MEDEPYSPPSFKKKLKQSLCLSCCFRHHHHRLSLSSDGNTSSIKPSLARASSKARSLISRIGKPHSHRRQSSTDFRYDPLSYSLNFEDGNHDSYLDDLPLRNFSARLPASPPQPKAVPEVEPPAAMREIAAMA